MADEVFVNDYDISGGGHAVDATADSTPASAVLTVKHLGKDQRRALRVANGGASSIYVWIAAGGGPRASLGEKIVEVAADNTAYIALFDTARFMALDSGYITVTLMNSDQESAVELSTELADVQIEAVQL